MLPRPNKPIVGQIAVEGTTIYVYSGENWIELSKRNSAFIIVEAALAKVGWSGDQVIEIMKNFPATDEET